MQPLTTRDSRTTSTSKMNLLEGGPSHIETQSEESVLCWNGEIFGGIQVPENENDGQVLFSLLSACQTEDEVLALLSQITGEWALVFYHGTLRKVWFGRDFTGRRSLTWRLERNRLAVSSVGLQGPKADESPPPVTLKAGNEEEGEESEDEAEVRESERWVEVPAKGLHCLSIEKLCEPSPFETALTWLPWGDTPGLSLPFGRMNTLLPSEEDLKNDANPSEANVNEFLRLMSESIRVRVTGVPGHCGDEGDSKLGILFSGGIDSMMMAALADQCLPTDEPIDLINVAFAVTAPPPPPTLERPGDEGSSEAEPSTKFKKGKKPKVISPSKSPFDVPDRVTGQAGLEELRALSPRRPWHFVEVNIPAEDLDEIQSRVRLLMYPSRTVLDLSIATALWCASRGIGKGLPPSLFSRYSRYFPLFLYLFFFSLSFFVLCFLLTLSISISKRS